MPATIPFVQPEDARGDRYFQLQVQVGGLVVTCGQVQAALTVLDSSPGLMVRQPLARAGSPLARCDYHTAAAPFRFHFLDLAGTGRGAAGRHLTKSAFCEALRAALAAASSTAGLDRLRADALAAFSADSSYATAMARSAVTLAARRHTAALRTHLHQAAHQAVSACEARRGQFTCHVTSPCGTGDCRFATGWPAVLQSTSYRGKQRRPANHGTPGAPFSSDDGLAELEEYVPFVVSIPIRDHDVAACADAVPGA